MPQMPEPLMSGHQAFQRPAAILLLRQAPAGPHRFQRFQKLLGHHQILRVAGMMESHQNLVRQTAAMASARGPGTITGLQNGSVVASIIQQPFMQGYLGAYLTTAMKVLGSAKVAKIMKPFLTGGVISTGVGTLTKANLPADNAYNKAIGAG